MWQTEWADRSGARSFPQPAEASTIKLEDVESVYLLHWTEHCVECAIPDCYRLCRLYVPRRDQKCARFRYGIVPRPEVSGLYDYGADIKFRRWGQLESQLCFGPVAPNKARRLAVADKRFIEVINTCARLLQSLDPKRRLNGAYAELRNNLLRRAARPQNGDARFDEFLIEAWNRGDSAFPLLVEAHQSRLCFRTSLLMQPGHNLHRIPYEAMNIDLARGEGRIVVRPDNDLDAHIVFAWLDFVRYTASARPARASGVPAPKVKCVVWDLDETLWKGILVDDGPGAIVPRPEAIAFVQELDKRGIMQSVASKNDHNAACEVLSKFGLRDYFLYPCINWGPKSAGIRQIANELNLGLDSFAFIDDSPNERSEVKYAIPELRVYAETEISVLLDRPEFEVQVTPESRCRRELYLQESRRKQMAAAYFGENESFLRSCDLHASVFTPREPTAIERCLELLHRSNQLNLTTNRYTVEEFHCLLANPLVLSVATSCQDKFGDYGIVGFASITLEDRPLLTDFVFSCRVAKKKVENAWIQYMADFMRGASYTKVRAIYIPTKRNGILLEVLQEAGFVEVGQQGRNLVLELSLDRPVEGSDIATVTDAGVRPLAKSALTKTV